MWENRIGVLLVTGNEGRYVGILSERDIVRAVSAGAGSDVSALAVEDLMTKDLITCSPKECPVDVLDSMAENKIRHMPVVENELCFDLRGLLSHTDIFNFLKEEAQSGEEEFLWHKFMSQM